MLEVDGDLGLAFITIAFALDHHVDGYIDSCFVLPEHRDIAVRTRGASLAEIGEACDRFIQRLREDPDIEPVRRSYLSDQVRAMGRRVDLVEKTDRSFIDEARALLDVEPTWIAESDFEADHALVADLLPNNSGPLVQRLEQFHAAGRVTLDENSPLPFRILDGLRCRTADRFGLPPGDEVSLSITDGMVSRGYHRYFGRSRSRIEIDGTQVLDVPGLVHLLAHEAYPGHHLELVHKEAHLVSDKGWLEHSLTVNDVPSCVISEGIATRGLAELMPEEDFIAWVAQLMENEGQDGDEAACRVALQSARQRLQSVRDNASLMLDASRDDWDAVVGYVQHYGLTSNLEARRIVRFIRTVGSYAFTYQAGAALVERYLGASDDRRAAFMALLREPYTPGRLRYDLARKDAV